MSDDVKKILLAHGGGGRLTDELIRSLFVPAFKNDILKNLGDSAAMNLPSSSICFTTDSYVIKPLFFNGGDIGKLAVCGTINDLAVSGARPLALSLGLIIEEGLHFEILEKIIRSAADTARQANVSIVTGDTKVVEKGAADQIFINTSGIGVRMQNVELGFDKIRAGDAVIVNGTIGDHGMTIMSQREGIKFESKLISDCAPLAGLTCRICENVGGIKFMRDATRGGLAAVLNEIAAAANLSIEITETQIPISPNVQAAADMLGFDVLNIANEGKFVAIVAAESADAVLKICKSDPLGKNASLIGRVVETEDVPTVELLTRIGGKRIVQMPYGRELSEDLLMHETMIAQSLLAAIAQEVVKLPNAKPVRAKVSCGKLYAINDELLTFAFEVIAKGTPCEGIKIELETKPLQAVCKACGKKFDLDLERIEQRCAHCGSDSYDVQPDAPLILEQVQFEQE